MDYSQFLHMHAELSLLLVIVVLFFADLFMCPDKKSGRGTFNTALPVVLMAIHTVVTLMPGSESGEAFGGMYLYTPMTSVMKAILSVGTLIVFLMAHSWLKNKDNLVKQGEFYLLTLSTLLGMFFMISSGHFLMFFIGLELASVPMAALVAFDKRRFESAEAGAKFILLALFSSALLLYGVSFIYGTCGTLYFNDLATHIDGSLVQILALTCFIAGMGFKISLVPFHLWTADTYEGAPTVVTSYLSVMSKGAAAFTLLVVLIKVFAPMVESWDVAFFWLVTASITIANIFAVRQKNLKRFMAFSAISQAGYVILGVMSGTAQGMSALVFYLLVYLVANLGAFAVLNVVEQHSGKIGMDDYNGLYQTNPRLAFLMTLCLFSLAGIPPFAGFFSKIFVFMSAFHAGHHLLVLIALINTVISLYYYLLIVKAMYIKTSDAPIATFKSDAYTRVGLFLCMAGVFLLGFVGVYNYLSTINYGI